MSVVGVMAAGAVGYLLGTVPSADIASRLAARRSGAGGAVDLRAAGSGNPGATNAAAVLGTRWGVAVLVADVVKGVLAAVAGRQLGGDVGGFVAGTAAVSGHISPVWSRFRGGKGVATSAGTCLALFPLYFPIDIGAAILGAYVAKRAETATRLASSVFVVCAALWWWRGWPNGWGPEPSAHLVAFAAITSALIIAKFAHARSAAERRAS